MEWRWLVLQQQRQQHELEKSKCRPFLKGNHNVEAQQL